MGVLLHWMTIAGMTRQRNEPCAVPGSLWFRLCEFLKSAMLTRIPLSSVTTTSPLNLRSVAIARRRAADADAMGTQQDLGTATTYSNDGKTAELIPFPLFKIRALD